jgi:hypothetical protein
VVSHRTSQVVRRIKIYFLDLHPGALFISGVRSCLADKKRAKMGAKRAKMGAKRAKMGAKRAKMGAKRARILLANVEECKHSLECQAIVSPQFREPH